MVLLGPALWALCLPLALLWDLGICMVYFARLVACGGTNNDGNFVAYLMAPCDTLFCVLALIYYGDHRWDDD